MDLSAYLVTGTNNSARQVSKDRFNAILNDIEEGVNALSESLPRDGTGDEKSLLGVVHNFPATTASGDDAPNVVLGSATGTDLPADTYGNLVFTPRDNDVSGGVGYRNRLGSSFELGFVLGGDNDIDALAAMNIGHHNRADTTGGGTPSHPMMVGTSLEVTSAYGVAIGTEHAVHATKAACLGGDANRVGTEGSADGARNSVALGGYTNTIDGQYAVTIGGQSCKAQKNYSIASGNGGITNDIGEWSHASGTFSSAGDCYMSRVHLQRSTTNNVATQLLAGGSVLTAMGSNSSHAIVAYVHGVRTDVAGEEAMYRVEALITNVGGTLAIKFQTVTALYEDDTNWNCDMLISGSAYQLRVTGANSKTIRWTARMERTVIRT